MKIVLGVVPQKTVARELLEAMAGSFDRFSQDPEGGFDFRLVRIDKFLVPPLYVERHDDACHSWHETHNTHPDRKVMETILTLSDDSDNEEFLHYAAVLYRAETKKPSEHWGGVFYLGQHTPMGSSRAFLRIDCRENSRDIDPPTSDDVYGWWPSSDRIDAFALPWVLARASRNIALEGGHFWWDFHRSPRPTERFTREFAVFRSGLGEIETLTRKVGDGRLCIRHGWACAAFQSTRPSPYDGAGKFIEKFFADLPQSK